MKILIESFHTLSRLYAVLYLIVYKLYAMNDSILVIVKLLTICNLIFKTQDISILIQSWFVSISELHCIICDLGAKVEGILKRKNMMR